MTEPNSTTLGRCVPKKNCSSTARGSVTTMLASMYWKYIVSRAVTSGAWPKRAKMRSARKISGRARQQNAAAVAMPAHAYMPVCLSRPAP